MESTFRLDGEGSKFKTPTAPTARKSHETPRSVSATSAPATNTPNGTPGDGAKGRKPRIIVTEDDHLTLIRLCIKHKEEMRSGNKMGFWATVRQGFKEVAGKDLSSPRHPVDKLIEDRKAQLKKREEKGSDEGEESSEKDGEREKLVDEWIVHLDKVAEYEIANGIYRTPGPRSESRAPRDSLRSAERKETPIPPPQIQKRPRAEFETPVGPAQPRTSPYPPGPSQHAPPPHYAPGPPPHAGPGPGPAPPPATGDEQVEKLLDSFMEEQEDFNRNPPPPQKRQRIQLQHQQRIQQDRLYGQNQNRPYQGPYQTPYNHQDPPQRVIVEGALTKDDWLEIIGHYSVSDPRIPQLEAKVDSLIETTKRTHQMLVQLLKNQARRPGNGSGDVQLNGDIRSGSQSLPP